jgi:hypothetical protein
VPPVFRDIYIQKVRCESAGVAIALLGLPEQPIEGVVLENLRLNAVEGIRCQEGQDITFNDVHGVVQEKPLFRCSNIRGLEVRGMILTQSQGEV